MNLLRSGFSFFICKSKCFVNWNQALLSSASINMFSPWKVPYLPVLLPRFDAIPRPLEGLHVLVISLEWLLSMDQYMPWAVAKKHSNVAQSSHDEGFLLSVWQTGAVKSDSGSVFVGGVPIPKFWPISMPNFLTDTVSKTKPIPILRDSENTDTWTVLIPILPELRLCSPLINSLITLMLMISWNSCLIEFRELFLVRNVSHTNRNGRKWFGNPGARTRCAG